MDTASQILHLALMDRDEAHAALYDLALRLPCGWSGGLCADGGIVGVVNHSEAGWLPACGAHFTDANPDDAIRLRGKAE